MDLSTDTVHAKNDLRFSNAMNLSLMQDYGVQCTFSKKHLVLVFITDTHYRQKSKPLNKRSQRRRWNISL